MNLKPLWIVSLVLFTVLPIRASSAIIIDIDQAGWSFGQKRLSEAELQKFLTEVTMRFGTSDPILVSIQPNCPFNDFLRFTQICKLAGLKEIRLIDPEKRSGEITEIGIFRFTELEKPPTNFSVSPK